MAAFRTYLARGAALGRTLLVAAIALSGAGVAASAAVITIDAAKLTAIYSQASFGADKIAVVVLPSETIDAPSLLNLTTDVKVDQLFALGPDNAQSRIVDAFFVNSIGSCGGFGDGIIGCANQPGHDLVVDSSYAQTDANEADLGHELGHNLGLGHVAGFDSNLMNSILGGSMLLTAGQVATILASPLVQQDTGRFIDVRPILIGGSVPELGTWAMMVIGFGMTGLVLRRRRHRA
jgi:hypothetical protein